ncbi:hypothetical protein Hanom_Chr01g00003181 [Helianthus anomalus]
MSGCLNFGVAPLLRELPFILGFGFRVVFLEVVLLSYGYAKISLQIHLQGRVFFIDYFYAIFIVSVLLISHNQI